MTHAWFRSLDGREYSLPVDGLEARDQEVPTPPGGIVPPGEIIPPNQEE